MRTYARLDGVVVAEIYPVPQELAALQIAELFHPDLVWVEVTDRSAMPCVGWVTTDAGVTFAEPPQVIQPAPPQPTKAELMAKLTALMTQIEAMA